MSGALQDRGSVSNGGTAATVDINPEAIFSHSDRTEMIDLLDDPLREFAIKLQAMGSVVKGHGVGTPLGAQVQFGDVILPNMFLTASACEGEVYAAVTWSTVRTLFTSPKLFSSSCFKDSLGRQGPTLTTMDPPEHTKYRRVAQPGFLPAPVQRYNAELIRPSIERRFSDLRPKGRGDLLRELTANMAFEINGMIIGFDPADVAFLATCKAMAFGHDREAGARASEAQNTFTKALIAKRRAEPKDDLISLMIAQEVDGEPVTERNLLGLVNVILAGGIDTIYKQSGNIICLLLNNPAQLDVLRGDRKLIPNFVEEAVRFEGVATNFPRMAIADAELGGTAIPKDSIVFGMIFAADRDPGRWANPHTLDAAREIQPNLAFSAGTHSCIGAQVARLALACFVEHLLDDLPNLRWDAAYPRPRITGWNQRMVLGLPTIWDPH